MHSTLFAGAAVAIAIAISPAAWAAESNVAAADAAPVVLAQVGAAASSAMSNLAVDPDLGAVNLRGVRKAARQGPDELRRYIFRTRMIYNFDYEDWAPKP
jgi:hypothetical protein